MVNTCWYWDQRDRDSNAARGFKLDITFLRSVIFHAVSPLLLVVCVGELVKLGRGMWMRPTMLGWSSATFSSCFSSSSSSPLSHVLLSDGYSYVLARLDSLKEILSCKTHRGRNIRTSSYLSSWTCYCTALIWRYCLFTRSLTDWFPLPPYFIFTSQAVYKLFVLGKHRQVFRIWRDYLMFFQI